MAHEKRKLVTIVTEALIEHDLLEDLQRLGAKGYTVTQASGKGGRGVRDADWQASGNIRVEVVCDERVAEAIASYLQEHYYQNYAMILFISEVEVLRGGKF